MEMPHEEYTERTEDGDGVEQSSRGPLPLCHCVQPARARDERPRSKVRFQFHPSPWLLLSLTRSLLTLHCSITRCSLRPRYVRCSRSLLSFVRILNSKERSAFLCFLPYLRSTLFSSRSSPLPLSRRLRDECGFSPVASSPSRSSFSPNIRTHSTSIVDKAFHTAQAATIANPPSTPS